MKYVCCALSMLPFWLPAAVLVSCLCAGVGGWRWFASAHDRADVDGESDGFEHVPPLLMKTCVLPCCYFAGVRSWWCLCVST